MKHIIIIFIMLVGVISISSCKQKSEDDMASEMLEDIEASVAEGDFRSALDSITILRNRYPQAINARKKALELWQEASLQQAQHEVIETDSLLQETLRAIENAPTLLEQNLLRNKRDSLQARYDAEVGVVKIIRAKQNGER